jgi:hypothetical protein
MVRGHHVDRLPHHAFESSDERVPGGLVAGEGRFDQLGEIITARKPLVGGHNTHSRSPSVSQRGQQYTLAQMRGRAV